MSQLWGVFTEVRSKPTDVDTLVYNSLLESYGTICKHLHYLERALLVSFKLAILSIPYKDEDIIVNLVIMGSSLGVLPDVIVLYTFLLLGPHFSVVGLEL